MEENCLKLDQVLTNKRLKEVKIKLFETPQDIQNGESEYFSSKKPRKRRIQQKYSEQKERNDIQRTSIDLYFSQGKKTVKKLLNEKSSRKKKRNHKKQNSLSRAAIYSKIYKNLKNSLPKTSPRSRTKLKIRPQPHRQEKRSTSRRIFQPKDPSEKNQVLVEEFMQFVFPKNNKEEDTKIHNDDKLQQQDNSSNSSILQIPKQLPILTNFTRIVNTTPKIGLDSQKKREIVLKRAQRLNKIKNNLGLTITQKEPKKRMRSEGNLQKFRKTPKRQRTPMHEKRAKSTLGQITKKRPKLYSNSVANSYRKRTQKHNFYSSTNKESQKLHKSLVTSQRSKTGSKTTRQYTRNQQDKQRVSLVQKRQQTKKKGRFASKSFYLNSVPRQQLPIFQPALIYHEQLLLQQQRQREQQELFSLLHQKQQVNLQIQQMFNEYLDIKVKTLAETAILAKSTNKRHRKKHKPKRPKKSVQVSLDTPIVKVNSDLRKIEEIKVKEP